MSPDNDNLTSFFQVDKVVVEEYGRMAVEGVGSHRLKRGIGELNGSRKRTCVDTNSIYKCRSEFVDQEKQ